MQEITRNSLTDVHFTNFDECVYRGILMSLEQEDYSFWHNLHLVLPQGPDYKQGKTGTIPYLDNIPVIESESSNPPSGDAQLRRALSKALDYIDTNYSAFEKYI